MIKTIAYWLRRLFRRPYPCPYCGAGKTYIYKPCVVDTCEVLKRIN